MRRSGAREFVVDTLVVGVTQVLMKLRALITLPLIVGVLGTASYGIWAQTLAFVSLTTAVLGLNLHLPLVRFVAGDPQRGPSVYASLLTATMFSALVGGAVVVACAAPLSSLLIGDDGLGDYLRVAMLLVLVGNVRLINLNVYRATGRLVARSVIELVTTFGELLGILVLLQLGCSLLQVFVFMAAWEALAAVGTTGHCLSLIGWSAPERPILREALKYTVPLLPAALAAWALDRGDRFVVGYYLGLDGVGVYSANYALGSLLMLFQAPLAMTLLPKVSALWDKDRPLAKRYIELSSKAFLTFAIPFAVGVPALAPFLLRHLGNAEIADAAGWTNFLVAAGVLLWGVGSMQLQVFHGARRTGAVGVVTLCAAALNLGLNFLLVPVMGVTGAALATLVAYAAVCATFAVLARREMRLDWHLVYLAKCVASAAIMALFLHWAAPARTRSFIGVTAAGVGLYFTCLLALKAFSAADIAKVRSVGRRLLDRRQAS